MAAQLVRVDRKGGNGDRILEMKCAWAAVVVQAVGDVDVLLELEQNYAASDCMNCPCRDEEVVAWANRPPRDEIGERSVECCLSKFVRRQLGFEPQGHFGI